MRNGKMLLGSVKWFSRGRGYGFIERKDGGKDVFFHQNDVAGESYLKEGDTVRFFVVQAPKGPRAFGVQSCVSTAWEPRPRQEPGESREDKNLASVGRIRSFEYSISGRSRHDSSGSRLRWHGDRLIDQN